MSNKADTEFLEGFCKKNSIKALHCKSARCFLLLVWLNRFWIWNSHYTLVMYSTPLWWCWMYWAVTDHGDSLRHIWLPSFNIVIHSLNMNFIVNPVIIVCFVFWLVFTVLSSVWMDVLSKEWLIWRLFMPSLTPFYKRGEIYLLRVCKWPKSIGCK
jgi:hypothetical protein